MSDVFRTLLRNLSISHKTSTPYHHESNGQVERANRTLQEQVAIAIKQHQDEWDNVLHLITHAYKNSSTKYSPHFLIHGHEPNNVFQLALRSPTKRFIDENDYAYHLINLLKDVYGNVTDALQIAHNQQKHHYDLRQRTPKNNYKVGDHVWIRKEGPNKSTDRFEGPFPIITINAPNLVVKDGRRQRTVHINRTKPHIGNANHTTESIS